MQSNDDLCPREITVADGRLELGSLKKDFLLGGQLQSLCVIVLGPVG